MSETVHATAFPRGVGGGSGGRAPQPGLAQVAELVARSGDPGLHVDYELVEQGGDLEAVPASIGLAVYRIVQESLTNVRRHSSAHRASVVVRIGTSYVEAEILDNGRPKGATSGSGLGHLGIRERIASLNGSAEIGPRITGGYRVRVRFPLTAAAAAPGDPGPARARQGDR